MWMLLRTRVGEDREVAIGVNWAIGRSLVSWTGAGVSPEGPAPHSPQPVGPSQKCLQGQNGVCLRAGSLRSQGCRPTCSQWATNPGVR